jgi:filamentous hemagglutinin family protein
MNKIHRVIWNEITRTFVAVAEITKARGKRASSRVGGGIASAFGLRPLALALFSIGLAHAAPPVPTQLPTGGQVVAGQAAINQNNAVMNVNQASNRAAIDWQTFNIGSQAQVNFIQPSASSAILNRVLDANPSQIFGNISSNGQVFLTNSSGIYFSPTSSANVGALTATTHNIGNADFMAGNLRFSRDGATGAVINEGNLSADLNGYIALLAPEVRNHGVVVAQLGTVALAAGEVFELQFDGNRLSNIRVEASTIQALVENGNAVEAPGGLIILSAQAANSLQGGVIRNSGRVEAAGLVSKGGVIRLEASDNIDNLGVIRANAGAIQIAAGEFTQAAEGELDVSGEEQGGSIQLQVDTNLKLAGRVDASAASGQGGSVKLSADGEITLQEAVVDASGASHGGRIEVADGVQPSQPNTPENPEPSPKTVAILGNSQLRAGSQSGQGGQITLTGERVGLFDATAIDASGATGGGTVLVGGDYQGKNPDVANAQATYVGEGVTIRADATDHGDGGKVIVWADGFTNYQGHISAQGGAAGGDGGFAEVSGKRTLDFDGTVDLTAARGKTGTLLLDPTNLTITTANNNVNGGTPFAPTGAASTLSVSTLATALDSADVVVTTVGSPDTGAEEGDITVASSIGWFSSNKLTLQAAGAITINDSVNIQTFDGSLALTAGTGITQNTTTPGRLLVGGTTELSTASGNISLNSITNLLTGAVTATASAGNISIKNARNLALGNVSASGSVTLETTANAGSIISSGTFAAGSLSAKAHDTGGLAIADVNGDLTVNLLEAGSAITLGDNSTGALTFTHASDGSNVIVGNDAAGGQASGVVTIKGASITLNDPIRTKGGNVNLTSMTGAVTTASDADIVTTADDNTGTSSGSVTVTAANGITLQNVTATGANNNIGVGSNAAQVSLTATTGDLNVKAITTSGGHAIKIDVDDTSNRNGGNAGNIILAANNAGAKIFLDGNLNAVGGYYVGDAARGLGGFITLVTPVVLTGDRLVSSGGTTGNIRFSSSIDSDATPRNLVINAGTGSVYLQDTIGGTSPLLGLTVASSNNVYLGGLGQAIGITTTATDATVTYNAITPPESADSHVDSIAGTTSTGRAVHFETTNATHLDDDVTFTRSSGGISFSRYLYSTANERNDLTFNGVNGGDVTVNLGVGGGGATPTTKLGDILFDTVADITIGETITAGSLVSLNGTGRINLGQNSNYSHYYDYASGLQLATTGTHNHNAGDENFYFYGNVTNSHVSAPISVSTPNGAISFYTHADLTTAGGDIELSAGTVATSGTRSVTLGSETNLNSNGGLVSLTGVGVSQAPSSTGAGINAGSGKIRIDGGGGAVSFLGQMVTTDNDSTGTPAVLITNVGAGNSASVRSVTAQTGTLQAGLIASDDTLASAQTLGGAGDLSLITETLRFTAAKQVTLTSVGNDSGVTFTITGTAANGDALVETISGGNGATVTSSGSFKTITRIAADAASADTVSAGLTSNDAIGNLFSQTNYGGGYAGTDKIDIKTLSAATGGAISITSTANVIDELGNFAVGSSLDVRAKGRVAGMALTGDVAATAVTIMTGNGALVLGTRDITATSGNLFLQGRGLTQAAGSDITASGTVTIYGSDYASENTRGAVTMAGTLTSASTSSSAVTFADMNALTLPSITIGSLGSRGGLRLGTHDWTGDHYRRAYGAISQTAGSQLKIGALDIRQNAGSGAIDLSLTNNEIQSTSYVERGGAITLYDKDSEGNGLTLTNIYDGSYDTLLTATTEGAMTMSGTNRGKGMTLTAGAAGFSGSGSIEGHHGGAGLISITTSGALALTSGNMYAKGVQLSSGAAGITSSVNIESHHGGGGDLILDAGGGDITLTNRLYNDGAGNDIIIQNADDVQLQRVEVYSTGKLILGGASTTPGTALTGNVTQTSYITANSDGTNLIGEVVGNVTLNNTNQIYRLGDFTSGGNFTFYNQDRTLVLQGALESTGGNVSVDSRDSLTVTSTGTVTANADTKGVILKASSNNWGQTANIQGAISANSGGISLTSPYGYVSTSGDGTLTTTGAVTIASAPNYTTENTNYSTTINAPVSAGVGGNNNISITSAGTFSNNATGTLTATGSVAIKTYWDGTNERNLTLGGNVTAGIDGIKLTSSGTINQTGGVLITTGTLAGLNQTGGNPSSGQPSARGAVTLLADNEIGNLGPFYLYDEGQVAFSVRDVSGGLTLAGNIENSHGAIAITTQGGALDLMGYDVYAGGMATGGANIALTGRGIIQAFGSDINTTGGATGTPRTGSNGGGTITLTGHDGTASGSILLGGTVETANASTSAVTIRGTSDLALPSIVAPNGGLQLGDDTATIGLITGNITQTVNTSLDIDTLRVGTATNAIGGSAVLANSGNQIVELAEANVGDVVDTQYDLDIYDSNDGLVLTQNLVSAGGIRVRTTTGGGASGALALGAQDVLAAGDIFLGGNSVTQAADSIVDADNSDDAATGGSIRIDGGGGANNITLEGALTTDNAGSTAVQIVNATNLTFNNISAIAGTVALGIPANTDLPTPSLAKALTGTIQGVDENSVISAATLAGNAGVVTLNKTNLDNLGTFVTTGTMTLKDQGGAGTPGLKFTGNVTVGGTTEIQTTDGVLDFDVHSLDASGGTGYGVTLRGVGVSQEAASSIKSTTAEIYGGNADIDLFSALNNFTGQVSVYSTGDQVSVQDTNQLSMNALTGNLDPTTSIKLWAGTGLVLTPEDITTTSGNIEFRSLDGNLSTPGNLTTTTGNIALHASTTAATGNVQVNNLITTGSGNVTVEAEKEVNLSKSIVSTSGDIAVSGATVTHSTGSSGDPLTLETGADGTITVVASGTGGFVMGQYYGYQSDTGTISITSGGTADLANITTNGTLTVDAVGLVQQVGSGSVLDADSLRVTTANNGAITLTNAGNDLNKVKLQSRNPANNDIGSGVIAFHDVDGFAVSEISTTGNATLTALGDVTTDSAVFGDGHIEANALSVKTLNDAGADILLTAANNDVNTLTLKVRNAADDAIAGETTTPTGTIRFTDADGVAVTSIETGGSTILTAGAAVTQTGAIVSDKLGLSGDGSFTLNSANLGTPINQVSTFASDAAGAINFSSQLALTIGTVNPVGITSHGANVTILAPSIDSTGSTIDTRSSQDSTAGGAVTLTTTGAGAAGNLTTGDIITSGTAAAVSSNDGGGAAGNVTLTASGESLELAGSITARGGAGDGGSADGADGRVKLTATVGAVTQTDGGHAIDAGLLLVNALNTSSLLDTANTTDLARIFQESGRISLNPLIQLGLRQ